MKSMACWVSIMEVIEGIKVPENSKESASLGLGSVNEGGLVAALGSVPALLCEKLNKNWPKPWPKKVEDVYAQLDGLHEEVGKLTKSITTETTTPEGKPQILFKQLTPAERTKFLDGIHRLTDRIKKLESTLS